jgi:hypothetical protein
MNRPQRWIAILIVAMSAVGLGVPAGRAAAQEARCKKVGIRVECYIKVVALPGGPPISVPLGHHVPFVWIRRHSNGLPGASFTCYREYAGVDADGVAGTVQEWGTGWVIIVIDPSTGGTLENVDSWITFSFDCEFIGEDPPEPPPPPPTPEQVVEAFADALVVRTELNPPAQWGGITGLDTWIWCNTPGAVALDPPLTLGGYTVNATMTPLLYTWHVDGPEGGSSSGPTCGSSPDEDGEGAAWTWQPQRMGDYTVLFTVDWTMNWSLTYDFGDGPVTLPATQYPSPIPVSGAPVAYSVDEFRGVLSG